MLAFGDLFKLKTRVSMTLRSNIGLVYLGYTYQMNHLFALLAINIQHRPEEAPSLSTFDSTETQSLCAPKPRNLFKSHKWVGV